MSYKLLIGVIGLSMIIGGGGVWWYQAKQGVNNNTEEVAQVSRENIVETLSGRFSDFVAQGKNVQCSFAGIDPQTGSNSQGTVYVSGDRFYIESQTTLEGSLVAFQMIQTDDVMYIWSDTPAIMPAMRIDMRSFQNTNIMSEDVVPQSPVDWFDESGTEIDYSCRSWSPPAGVFMPPSDIEFMNPFSDMMQMMIDFEAITSDRMMQTMQAEGLE